MYCPYCGEQEVKKVCGVFVAGGEWDEESYSSAVEWDGYMYECQKCEKRFAVYA